MENGLLPILLFIGVSSALAVGLLLVGSLLGPPKRGQADAV
jgi:NADH:ubiquinone oxidoreductase subunit 3 (subunit A)